MRCMLCKNEIALCTCPDIEERLKLLEQETSTIGPAVRLNLWARKLVKDPPKSTN